MATASLSLLEQRFAKLRANKLFELSVIAIIVFSALIIGVKTYPLPAWTQPVIVGLDWAITLFFLVEISIRFLGDPSKRTFFKNAWNVFDTFSGVQSKSVSLLCVA